MKAYNKTYKNDVTDNSELIILENSFFDNKMINSEDIDITDDDYLLSMGLSAYYHR